MTASSQTSPGALPPELPPVQPSVPDAAREAYAAYGVALPVRADIAQAVPDPARTVRLATGVISAAMTNGSSTAAEIAQAELAAGILFDPERAAAIASAAYEQARAEDSAELAAAAQDRTTLEWLRARWRAIGQLCEGRPDTDLLMVREVLAAADGTSPTGAPLALKWDGLVMGPSGDTEGESTLVPVTTARGGSAALVLPAEQRRALGSLLDLQVRDINAECPTVGCGSADDLDASDPTLLGWSRLEIAALGDGPRWYCCDECVFDALARAGDDLVDPDEPIPFVDTTVATPGGAQ
ncbi:hypothetical protein [Streptomyces sp. SID13726]|uniref:hypothetical protein n=1 Tax=Streptomyces sp. SID13726 TaxID=2706058 RepID=UPI0013B8B502|nr:hypothetical protein [Streptomyces sp. SID13726]NEB00591.1 hypothetical protein [Streptomyces sp. SID13726]